MALASTLASRSMIYRVRDHTGQAIEEMADRHTWNNDILTLYADEQVIARFTDPLDWYSVTQRPRVSDLKRALDEGFLARSSGT